MRKLNLLAIALFLVVASATSQELGVRFGDVTGGNVAVDGIISLGQFSRVHADVSFGNNGVGVDALWDFMYRPLSNEAFNWYAGAGPYFYFHDPFFFGIAGELGLEYRFNEVPISLSGDWRPEFQIVNTTNFDWGGFGFNVRYIFGRN